MFGRQTRDQDVGKLFAAGRPRQAIQLLRRQVEEQPRNAALRLQLAEVLSLSDQMDDGIAILRGLVDEHMDDGEAARAIAVLKRIARIDPRSGDEAIEHFAARIDQARADSAAPATTRRARKRPATGTLLSSPLFGELDGRQLLALVGGLRLKRFSPGQVLVTEGQPGESMMVLAAGRVRVDVRNEAGEDVQVRTLEAGSFFGEISLLHQRPRTATLTAVEECEVLVLDRETVRLLGKRYPEMEKVIRRFCEERLESREEIAARQS